MSEEQYTLTEGDNHLKDSCSGALNGRVRWLKERCTAGWHKRNTEETACSRGLLPKTGESLRRERKKGNETIENT